jgi:nucleotide-binding universal stress UspA family protein
MIPKVLVANDGSPGGEKAVKGALDLAKRLNVGVTMICVENVARFPSVVDVAPEAQRETESKFDSVIDADTALAKEMEVPFEAQLVAGDPVERILGRVENGGFDLLVVGYTGHSAFLSRLIGSTANRLVSAAPCTVMVVK